ncbi:hypothetical protein JTB14_012984 [Gonioctena quinquepunctata]|nr:hypothetical protein JTB14_012984 [Gonioctena quinquepunctata]
MAPIKIEHIISFSSEDPAHVADNILSNDSKKWKCRTVGEKNAVVVLQLEKATEIIAIDIGNEHSAYIEVLVTRSGASDDYKVLLVTSSFMTPIEARQSQNPHKVRMFTREHLSKPECEEKWDRVKVVCTQPFNKHVQYGLSFITLHTKGGKEAGTPLPTSLGKFALRPDSPDELSAGSLFAKRKEFKHEEKLTGAAAIREAATPLSLARYGSPHCKPKLKTRDSTPKTTRKLTEQTDQNEEISQKNRNRNELFYTKDDEEPHAKIDKIMKKKEEEDKEKSRVDDAKKEEKKKNFWGVPETKKKDSLAKVNGKHGEDGGGAGEKRKDTGTPGKDGIKKKEKDKLSSPGSSKQEEKSKKDLKRKMKDETSAREESKKKKKVPATKPFEKLLEGVILVMSGIQNPGRGMLRTMALSMGAKYKPDWEEGCTHLICAFPNTPKFNQVKGKGKIVKRAWLEECHGQRKRLPWRRFALDKGDQDRDESEDEIIEDVMHEAVQVDEVSDGERNANFSDHKDEGSDTEERIAKILASKTSSKADPPESPAPNEDVYSVETDVEEDLEKSPAPEAKQLPNFFAGKIFYIDSSFDDETYWRLRKYIVAYKGKPADGPTDGVEIIVTTRQNSATLREINGEASCVSTNWIWECHNKKKLLPLDDYVY